MSEGYELIHAPADPHTCAVPRIGSRSVVKNKTIIVCVECGTYWWAKMWHDSSYGLCGGEWKKVRWYHWRLRKKC